jgi:hypothetical protein
LRSTPIDCPNACRESPQMPTVEPANTRTTMAVVLTLGLAALITVLTLMPMPQGGLPGSDKFYHVLAFSALAVPLSVVAPSRAILVFFGVVAYGGAIEVIQPTFHRMGEWADLRADAIGAAAGVLVGVSVGMILQQMRRRRAP